MNAAPTLIVELDEVAAAVRARCSGADGDMPLEQVTAMAGQLGEVATRIGAIYDTLAELLYSDGCPGRHASDDFALAANHLHAAGAACRLANQALRARKAAMLDMFRELRVWDGVITPYVYDGVLWFGRVARHYQYDPNRIPGLVHVVPVKWLDWIWRTDIPPQIDKILGAGIEIFKPAAQQPFLELDVWSARNQV
jgi:hypothetical protein